MSQLLPERTPEWLKPALGVDPSQVQAHQQARQLAWVAELLVS